MSKYLIILVFFIMSSSAYANGCFNDQSSRLSVTPLTPGPLVLSSYYCRPEISEGVDQFAVSPNGDLTVFLSRRTVTISSLNGKEAISFGTGPGSSDGFYGEGNPLLRWAKNSKSVWASEREVAKPSGFSLSGLKPLQIFVTGKIKRLPSLNHPAGPLDKLLWINSKGLAFAVFGTYSSYSPSRPADPNAAFAIVDAARGLILDSLPISDMVEVIQKKPSLNNLAIKRVTTTILPNGRVRVLFSILGLNEWVLWTQNERPRLLKHPYMDLSDIQLTLSPDGEKVLVFQNLRTYGAVIEEIWAGGRGYVPGKPVSGLLVSLYDFNTSKELWKIFAKVARDPSGAPPAPVISKNGRFALIRFPADTEAAFIALVSMQDGKILQRLPIPTGLDSSSYAMGFTDQGVWTRTYNLTALYSFILNK